MAAAPGECPDDLQSAAAETIETACEGPTETVVIEESGIAGKRPRDENDDDSVSKRTKLEEMFSTPMEALVTIAGGQQQIVVEQQTAGNQVDQPATYEVESITEMGAAVDGTQLAASQVVAPGTFTLANTTSEVQVVTAQPGASDMDTTTAGPQITLLAIDTGDDGSGEQGGAIHVTGDTPDSDIINQCWFSPKDDKDNPQGIKWKSGMWSKTENEVLRRNIDEYLKTNNISTAEEVIFELSKEERKDFYRTIARGIKRPLFAVYRRVLRMYDKKNYLGKYTTSEVDQLKELRQKHGNDWAAIGAAMNRSASSVKDRCRLMKEGGNSGKWTDEEEKRLSCAVHEITGTKPGDYVTCSLPWAKVAEKVGTRTEKQCRSKWLNYLNWKEAGGVEWKKRDEVELIDRVYGLQVDDENEIDWAALSHDWKAVRSPQWLRSKWWALKRHVPDTHVVNFRSSIDYLNANHASLLRNKVEKHDPRPRTASGSGGQQAVAMALPFVSLQGGQLATLSGAGKGAVAMVPVQLNQGGANGGTAVILSGDMSLEAVQAQLNSLQSQSGDQPQAYIIQSPFGGSLGSHTVLVQSHTAGQPGETIAATVGDDTGGHDTEVSMPGATPVTGADDSVESETTTEVEAGLTEHEVGLAAHIQAGQISQANATAVMIAQGVTEESTITTG
jgi:hypothetical protein